MAKQNGLINNGKCKVEGCEKPQKCRGYCSTHDQRIRRGGGYETVRPKREIRVDESLNNCLVDGCERKNAVNGYCGMHYQRIRRRGESGPPHQLIAFARGVCSVEGCSKLQSAHGYCTTHESRTRDGGDVGLVGLMRRANGTGTISKSSGYHFVGVNGSGPQLMHRIIAEKALGHALPESAVIHHIDENRANNDHSNLVICENDTYHKLLHRRQNALDACGNANWRKCAYCKKYDDPLAMHIGTGYSTSNTHHIACANEYARAKKAKKALKA